MQIGPAFHTGVYPLPRPVEWLLRAGLVLFLTFASVFLGLVAVMVIGTTFGL